MLIRCNEKVTFKNLSLMNTSHEKGEITLSILALIYINIMQEYQKSDNCLTTVSPCSDNPTLPARLT